MVVSNERRPLLARPNKPVSYVDGEHNPLEHARTIDFNPDGDSDNPLEWSRAYKTLIVLLLAFMAFVVTFICIGIVPVASRIVADLDGRAEKSAGVLLVTIWELGEAAGPLVIAPLSERYGRWPVYNVTNIIFILFVAVASLSQSSSAFIVARFLNGCAVATNVLNPAIIGDLFPSEERGSPMSLILFAPLIGGALGPGIAGAIVESATWRHILFMGVGLALLGELGFLFLFRETYKVKILRRRAQLQREQVQGKIRAAGAEPIAKGEHTTFWENIRRPVRVFICSSVLQMLSVFSGVIFAFFYVMSTTLPDILEDEYKLDTANTGLSFMSFSAGSALGVIVCNLLVDRIFIRLNARHPDKPPQPENRFPLLIAGMILFPFVVAAYGFTAQLHGPVTLLLGLVAAQGFLVLLMIIPTMTYVTDAFGQHSASAVTAVLITRCLAGTFLPLATSPLVQKLGYGWAMTIMAGLVLAVLPLPLLVSRFGHRWRQKCPYTRDAVDE